MKNDKNNKTICWALDPFQDNIDYHLHGLKVIKPLASALKCQITPVTFVSKRQLQIRGGDSKNLTARDTVQLITTTVEARLKQIFNTSLKSSLSKPRILLGQTDNIGSHDAGLAAIDNYAKSINAEFVALHSHARKGIKRLFLGSFAETFVLQSNTTTLLINPSCKVTNKYKSIIFPTDFSKESLATFKVAVEYAKKLNSDLKIVNCIFKPKLSIFLSGEMTKKQVEDEYRQSISEIKKQAEKMLSKCKSAKVKSSFDLLEAIGTFDPAEAIDKYSKKVASPIIIMTAKSNTLKTKIIGATSRELARITECPILIHRN